MEINGSNFTYYLPTSYVNSSYSYSLQEDYILVNKNTNCYSQYNTTYCDCFRIYPNYNYLSTNTYSCNINNSYLVSYDKFNSNIYNSPYFYSYFLIYFCIALFCVYFIRLFFGVFRKRSV